MTPIATAATATRYRRRNSSATGPASSSRYPQKCSSRAAGWWRAVTVVPITWTTATRIARRTAGARPGRQPRRRAAHASPMSATVGHPPARPRRRGGEGAHTPRGVPDPARYLPRGSPDARPRPTTAAGSTAHRRRHTHPRRHRCPPTLRPAAGSAPRTPSASRSPRSCAPRRPRAGSPHATARIGAGEGRHQVTTYRPPCRQASASHVTCM